MLQKHSRAFTLVELLVVIAIIGLLAAVSVMILNGARRNSRDAKRVSDVQIIRAALEQHWVERAAYPLSASPVSLGTGTYQSLTSNGFEATPTGSVYLERVPVGARSGEYYTYECDTGTAGYTIQFTTEGQTSYGAAGTYYAHSSRVDTEATQK
jgi:prepilin-type N-terminal cleavage/methylation domain-containing protein